MMGPFPVLAVGADGARGEPGIARRPGSYQRRVARSRRQGHGDDCLPNLDGSFDLRRGERSDDAL